MHVVHLEDGRVEVSEESRPAVLEVLCDECETALNFDEVDETIQKELRLGLQAVFDVKPHLTAWWLKLGYHTLTVLFLFFTAVYSYAALR